MDRVFPTPSHPPFPLSFQWDRRRRTNERTTERINEIFSQGIEPRTQPSLITCLTQSCFSIVSSFVHTRTFLPTCKHTQIRTKERVRSVKSVHYCGAQRVFLRVGPPSKASERGECPEWIEEEISGAGADNFAPAYKTSSGGRTHTQVVITLCFQQMLEVFVQVVKMRPP